MRTFRHSSPLFDKAGDPGIGSGGGDPEKPFTDAQNAAIGAAISGALKSEGKRLVASALTEALPKALEGLKIGETIAAEVAKLKPAEPPEPKPGDKKTPDPEVAALKATVQELTTKLATDAEERKKLEQAARDKDALAALKTALGPLVRPEALEIAARDLFHGQKRVTFDEQGNPLLTVRRAAFAGGSEEDVAMPLADGVQHWIKSTEGKFFAPAPGGGGADPKGGGAPRRVSSGSDGLPRYDKPAESDDERDRRAEERTAAYRQRFPNLT
jgi:hypothetical protein